MVQLTDKMFQRTSNIEAAMTIHEMKLEAVPFDYILNGTKRIELRLNDEKRQKVKIGEIIKFYKLPELEETLEVKIIGLLKYTSFKELIKDFDILILADKLITKEQLIEDLNRFYSLEEQNLYSVLGIRFELI